MRFRKRPVVVDAWPVVALWGTPKRPVPKLLRDATDAGIVVGLGPERGADIKTLEGTMRAAPGDYIIRGIKGEFYPCKPEIFHATYESAEEP